MTQILLAPLIASIVSQVSKLFIKTNGLKFSWRSLTAYSGMPSSHAATTVSLSTIVGLTQGFNSPLFAVSAIFTILVIRDALGLRSHIGQHGEILNALVKDLKNDQIGLMKNYPLLVEKIGHTPSEIIAGSILGILISLLSYYIF